VIAVRLDTSGHQNEYVVLVTPSLQGGSVPIQRSRGTWARDARVALIGLLTLIQAGACTFPSLSLTPPTCHRSIDLPLQVRPIRQSVRDRPRRQRVPTIEAGPKPMICPTRVPFGTARPRRCGPVGLEFSQSARRSLRPWCHPRHPSGLRNVGPLRRANEYHDRVGQEPSHLLRVDSRYWPGLASVRTRGLDCSQRL
jgi:hypothetical protein